MPFLEEMAWLMEAAGVAASSDDVFLTEKDEVPLGPGPWLSVRETGGTGAERRQEQDGAAYQRPAGQFLATAEDYQAARALAAAAYDACDAVENEELDGTYYVDCRPLQEPFGLGLDGNRRARVAFNVIGDKRPS